MAMNPTVSKKRKRDNEKAWKISMDLFVAWSKCTPGQWKRYLQDSPPLPDLPRQVLNTYANVPPPPLEELCPVDFQMHHWESFKEEMDDWLEKQPDDPGRPAPCPSPAADFRIVLLGMLHMSGQVGGGSCRTALCCVPDAMDLDCEQQDINGKLNMCLVGNMAWDLDEHTNLEIEVARLYSYMLLTGCYFGLVSCYTKTFACKRLPGLDRCVFVSPAVHYTSGDALKTCAFVAWQGQNFAKIQAENASAICIENIKENPKSKDPIFSSSRPREFIRDPIKARLRELGNKIRVADMNDLLDNLVWWDDLSTLKDLHFCAFSSKGRMSAKGTYTGTNAYVKFRDLSNSKQTDTDSMLRMFLQEVDVYARLRALQGEIIPKLLQYGFLRGATVCFVVMSDHGNLSDSEDQRLLGKWPGGSEECARYISDMKGKLQQIHACGVHFGGQPTYLGSYIVEMSHGVVDGNQACMLRDVQFMQKLYKIPDSDDEEEEDEDDED